MWYLFWFIVYAVITVGLYCYGAEWSIREYMRKRRVRRELRSIYK